MTLISSISGIRGTIGGKSGEGLTPIDIMRFSLAYGQWVIENSSNTPLVILGRDARISGEMVQSIVVGALTSLGIDIINLGLATTPTVEMAVEMESAQGGIIITASHNPSHWNALKLLNQKGEFIDAYAGNIILKKSKNISFNFAPVEKLGKITRHHSYLNKHIEAILALDAVDIPAIQKANFKIGVDGVNSIGSWAVPQLLDALGVQHVKTIFDDPNGKFERIAEPLNEHLGALCELVQNENLDLGIAVDPDVDRLALVADGGIPMGEENTLVTIADYILAHTPSTLVANMSSTKALQDIAEKHKVPFEESAVGEVNVVTEMKKNNAVIGGEGNGGVIYPLLHYGRDALVGIALYLSYLTKIKKKSSTLLSSLPKYTMIKDKVLLGENVDLNSLFTKIKTAYYPSRSSELDGLKVYLDEGWIHLRKSNTEPIIRLYIEHSQEEEAYHLKKQMLKLIVNL